MASQLGKIILRKSSARGHADHGWLNTYHTFSFASYHDPKFEGFGPIRVLNEDRVTANEGFGTHPHNNYEIFSYIISGELTHRDSMGNKETLKRGEVQFTSAGTGISHSEFNENPSQTVHFLQIWVKPNQRGLKPSYSTKSFSDEQKKGKLCRIVSGSNKDSAISINNDIEVFASILEQGNKVKHSLKNGRRGFLHVCQTGGSILLNGQTLEGGDGAFISELQEIVLEGKSNSPAEVLLFDLE